MTTAFSATKVSSFNYGPNRKEVVYTVQLPDSWTAAGFTWDLSADFDFVFSAEVGVSGAITDHAHKLCLFGTIVTTGKGAGGVAAAGVTLGGHRDAGSAAAFAAIPNSTDLSAVNDLTIIVRGC